MIACMFLQVAAVMVVTAAVSVVGVLLRLLTVALVARLVDNLEAMGLLPER